MTKELCGLSDHKEKLHTPLQTECSFSKFSGFYLRNIPIAALKSGNHLACCRSRSPPVTSNHLWLFPVSRLCLVRRKS